MIIKTQRFDIKACTNYDKKELINNIIRPLQWETKKIMNNTIIENLHYYGDINEFKKIKGIYPERKELFGKSAQGKDITSVQNYSYNQYVANDNLKSNSGNINESIRKACYAYNTYRDRQKEYDNSVGLPNYKNNNPVDISSTNIILYKENNKYYAKLSLISSNYKKDLKIDDSKFRFIVRLNTNDDRQKNVIDNILNKNYKLAASTIILNKKQFSLNLTYKIPREPSIFPENILTGCDLGQVNAIYLAFSDDNDDNKLVLGSYLQEANNRIRIYTDKINKKKYELQKHASYCGQGSIGHGRKKRLEPLTKLENKVKNFRKNINNNLALFVVRTMLNKHSNWIQMEDLSGISEKHKFLKSWPYFDLQTKIEHKLLEYGLFHEEVVNKVKVSIPNITYIDPAYTSQRCSECGYIDIKNRDGKHNQSKFECVHCGYKANADYNAAKNMTIPHADDVIYKQMLKQKDAGLWFDEKYLKRKLSEKNKNKNKEIKISDKSDKLIKNQPIANDDFLKEVI